MRDRIITEFIRGTAQVEQFGGKVREAVLGWFGHVHRRGSGCTRQRMLEMELTSKRKKNNQGRHAEEDAKDKVTRRQMICCGNP